MTRRIAPILILVLAAACDDPADAEPGFEGRWSLVSMGGFDVPLLLLSAPASQVPVELPPECADADDSVDVWLDGATLELLDAGVAEVDVVTRYDLSCVPPAITLGDVFTTTGSWTEQGDEIALELGDSIPLSEDVWLSPEGESIGRLTGEDQLSVQVRSGVFNFALEFEREAGI